MTSERESCTDEDSSPSYDALVQQIRAVPKIWLLGLLTDIIQQCVKRKLFSSDEVMLEGIRHTMYKAHAPVDNLIERATES